jgi:hypothetical protein
MIDTLHLNLLDFEVKAGSDLELKNGTTSLSTGISTGSEVLWREGSNEIRGAGAFYNGPDFNLSISPIRGAVYAIATFSAPKLATGSNYAPADAATLKTALNKLEADLKSIGVHANVHAAKVARLDATKNVLSDESFESYYPILKALPCRLADKWDYGSSLLLKNTQQELGIYDKIAEMVARKHNVDKLPKTIRFEQRFKTSGKVKSYLGMSCVGEVVDNLDYIATRYSDSMKANLFKLDTFEYDVTTTQQFVSELTALKHLHISPVQSYLMLRGYQAVANSEDAFLAAVSEVYDNRMSVSRAKKKLHELKMESMSLDPAQIGRKKSSNLYEELKTKVLS